MGPKRVGGGLVMHLAVVEPALFDGLTNPLNICFELTPILLVLDTGVVPSKRSPCGVEKRSEHVDSFVVNRWRRSLSCVGQYE